jgi:hypothetical protein
MSDAHPQGGDLFNMAKDGTKGQCPYSSGEVTKIDILPPSARGLRQAEYHPLRRETRPEGGLTGRRSRQLDSPRGRR